MDETQYIIFDVKYEVKGGKNAHTAYHGDERTIYEQVIEELHRRTDLARLYESETHTKVTTFEEMHEGE